MKISDKDFRGRKGMEKASVGFTGIQCLFCVASGIFLTFEVDVTSKLPFNEESRFFKC